MQQSNGKTHVVRRGGGPLGLVLVSAATLLGLTASAGAATAPPSGGAASGSVAALSGSSMEVQNAATGQTTVNWTGSTVFSETATKTASAVAVGDCLTVTGTPSKKSKTTIAARTVVIDAPSTAGSCTAGFAGGGNAGGAIRSGSFPGGGGPGRFAVGGGAGAERFRSGSFNGGHGSTHQIFPGANLSFGTGKVTAVSGSSVSMSGVLLGGFTRPSTSSKGSKKSKTPPKPTPPKTQALKVTLASSTTVTQTQTTTSSALAVGDCVSAFGQMASNGAVTASTVRITSTGGKTCTAGFAGGGFPGSFVAGGPGGGFPGGFKGGGPGGG